MFSQLNKSLLPQPQAHHDLWTHLRLVRGTFGSRYRGPRVEDPKGLGREIGGNFGACNGAGHITRSNQK